MEEKKTLKGFTLVELIIVLAIFSVILALVMSFIDPVSDLMKKTSIRERTAAYSDNISEYIDNSLHYAKYLYVYQGGLFSHGNTTQAATPQQVAADIVRNNLDGAVDKTKTPIEGKVRIMKFDNTPDADGHVGQIYEAVYNFECGNSANSVPPTITEIPGQSDFKPVLNPEHFENYNYHYSIGYYDFKAFSASPGSHDSWLVAKQDKGGNDMANQIAIDNFPINIIAYGNSESDARYMVERDKGGGVKENVPAFKSPSHMSTVSMALINARNIGRSDVVDYYSFNSTDNKFEPINGEPFYRATSGVALPPGSDEFEGTSFYIAYILPYEIYDTEVALF